MTKKTKIVSLLLFCFSMSLPIIAQQPVTKDLILQKVEKTDPYIREVRGYLHEHPELSGQEVETAKFIQAEIAKLGLPVTKVRGTGFYAILDTKRPGKTIG
jgi:metal-dependent amidase/aminoacylase/carboxypeptidase family protein